MFGGVEGGAGYAGVHEAVAGIADFPGFGCKFLIDEVGRLAAGAVFGAGGLGGVGVGGGEDGYGYEQWADGGQWCSFRVWSRGDDTGYRGRCHQGRASLLSGNLDDEEKAKTSFGLGCAAAAVTHGHPLGYLPADFLSSVIFYLVSGRSLEEAVSGAMMILVERPEYEKSTIAAMIAQAIQQSRKSIPSSEVIERLGGGLVGDEGLAHSFYFAFAAEGDFARGVRLAVNHSGDSDSTGAITGNILGALLGKEAIAGGWVEIEMREVGEGIGEGLMAVGRGLIEKN